jgi:transposase
MTDVRLTDDQWTKIREFLKQDPNAYVGNEAECRRFVEAVKWISRSGAQWRLLPAEFGNWNSVYKRFARWCDNGVWERMLDGFADDPDMENGMMDHDGQHDCARSSLCGRCRKKTVNKLWDAVEAVSVAKSISWLTVWAILCALS